MDTNEKKFEVMIYKIGYWINGVFCETETPCSTAKLAETVVRELNLISEVKNLREIYTYLPFAVRTK